MCGAVRYTLTGEPTNPHLCHCKMCQKWSGAPVVGWVDFPRESITYTKAKPALYRSSKKSQRGFCATCGGTLFALDDGSDLIAMTTASLDQPGRLKPEYESYKTNAISWMKKLMKPLG